MKLWSDSFHFILEYSAFFEAFSIIKQSLEREWIVQSNRGMDSETFLSILCPTDIQYVEIVIWKITHGRMKYRHIKVSTPAKEKIWAASVGLIRRMYMTK